MRFDDSLDGHREGTRPSPTVGQQISQSNCRGDPRGRPATKRKT